MKHICAAIVIGALAVLVGCDQGVLGGFGASKTRPKQDTAALSDASKAKWNDYASEMQKRLEQFSAQYAELRDRAAKAEGQAKTDLDTKLAEAKTKRDAAAIKLDELKSAGADRWEKVKVGVEAAFDDLKKIFE
ncbi:MAG: hypothetical protein HZB26_05260 [Candidatus Hydrogenedentes bacterium]|nr:hypothetical protein [Candidatus Hydrogenedentota bacterium]